MDFVRLDVALGANDKGTAQCHTLFFDQYLEVSGELMGGVSEHGVLYLANGRRAVMPCFVGEVGICGNRENLRSEEHTSELQSRGHLVCRLLLEKKKMRWRSANRMTH